MSFELLLSRGRPDYAVSTDPAANTEASITVPSGSTWVILAAHLTVVQGATQTPLPSLVITTTAAQGSVVIGTYAGRFGGHVGVDDLDVRLVRGRRADRRRGRDVEPRADPPWPVRQAGLDHQHLDGGQGREH
jgi:hypothetical protein